jgi:hypothetical protein
MLGRDLRRFFHAPPPSTWQELPTRVASTRFFKDF